MTTTATKRRCQGKTCITILSAYNPSDYCGACTIKQTDEAVARFRAGLDAHGVTSDGRALHSRDSLLGAIQAWYDRHGTPPGQRDCGKEGLPSRSVYQYHFGTWRTAREAAGFPVEVNKPPPSPRRMAIVRAIRAGHDDTRAIGEVTGLTPVQVRRTLNQMRLEGLADNVRKRRTDHGPGATWYLIEGAA